MNRFNKLAVGFGLGLMMGASALAQGNGRDFVVPADTEARLDPGAHVLQILELRKDAKLHISGNTMITAKTVIAEDGATIIYDGQGPDANPSLTINAIDASRLTSLTIIGNGVAGAGFNEGDRARSGAAGRRAYSRFEDFKWKNRDCGGGGNGASGDVGQAGTNALDVVLYTPLLNPGSKIAIEAIGGAGGRAQDGGNGGQGGGGSKLHTPCRGGNGGAAGTGGAGGDAGRVSVIFITKDMPPANPHNVIDEQLRSVTIDVKSAAGARGSGGSGGYPGTGGDENDRVVVDGSVRERAGSPGARGADGAEGDGPKVNAKAEQWVTFDLLDANSFIQSLMPQFLQAQKEEQGSE